MWSTLTPFRRVMLLACATSSLLSLWFAHQSEAQSSCHDGIWDPDEYCGRDAWLTTGKTEMNHDCRVDILDLQLFADDYGWPAGPNLSGDFNGDGYCDLSDLFIFAGCWYHSVSPCSPSGVLPDLCQGTIALSFSTDSTNIVSTTTQSPGLNFVYLVIDGWTDAKILEYSIEASPNIRIWYVRDPIYPHWNSGGCALTLSPDSMHTWCAHIYGLGDPWDSWPAGPLVFTWVVYELLDMDPAWFKITTIPSCFDNDKIRWAKGTEDRSYHFATVLNAGINGPAPSGQSTCPPVLVPALDRRMVWVLVVVMMGLAVAVLRLKRRSGSLVRS